MAGELEKKKYLFLIGKSMLRYLAAAMATSHQPPAISHKLQAES
jgi:hypothetical protein